MATTTLNVHIHVYFVTTGLTNSWRQIKHAKGRSSSSLELTTYLLSSSASESTIHSLHPNIPSPRSRRLRFSSCSFCHSFSYKIESFGFHYNLPTTLVIDHEWICKSHQKSNNLSLCNPYKFLHVNRRKDRYLVDNQNGLKLQYGPYFELDLVFQ